jgi:DNA end-binding protein Ku
VQSVAALGVESAKVRDAELKLARQLIEQQSAETFDPAAFPDEVKARVEAAIQRKVEGKQVRVAEPGPAPGTNVVDLMSALKASLERGSRRPPRRAPARAADRAQPRARRKAAHS